MPSSGTWLKKTPSWALTVIKKPSSNRVRLSVLSRGHSDGRSHARRDWSAEGFESCFEASVILETILAHHR